jgi:putative endonuclease
MPAAAKAPDSKLGRLKALGKGQRAESLAALTLRLKGYRILSRGFSARGGEIDIIAQRGSTIAFVEVKCRRSLMHAMAAIDANKRKRMSCAVRAWLVAHPAAARYTLSGDAVYVTPWRWPRHIRAAIPLDLG